MNWISVKDRLPENSNEVLCANKLKNGKYHYYVGVYARKHEIIIGDEDFEGEDFDSDENEGRFYLKEGWYELTEQVHGEYDEMYLDRECTHWQSIEPPNHSE